MSRPIELKKRTTEEKADYLIQEFSLMRVQLNGLIQRVEHLEKRMSKLEQQ